MSTVMKLMFRLIIFSLKKIRSAYMWTIMNIILIFLILLSISFTLPIYQYTYSLTETYQKVTQGVIKVYPSRFLKPLSYDYLPGMNISSYGVFREYFNSNDIEKIKSIIHVKKVVAGLLISGDNSIDLDYIISPGENKTLLVSRYLASLLNIDTKLVMRHIQDVASRKGISIDEAAEYVFLMNYELLDNIYAVNLSDVGDILGEFNDLVYGDYINESHEIVIAPRSISIPLINKSMEMKLGIDIYIIYRWKEGIIFDKYKVVGFLAPNDDYSAVISYEDALEILSAVYGQYKDGVSLLEKFPIYNLIYVYVDDPDNTNHVASEINRLFPNALVVYGWIEAELLSRILDTFSTNILYAGNILITLGMLIIGVARYIEGVRNKVEYGLLEAMGWMKRHIFISIFVYSSIIGLIAGCISSLAVVVVHPYITELFSNVDYIASESLREHYNLIIKSALSKLKYSTFILLNPLLGSLICGFSSIIPYLVFQRKELDEILRGY